VHQYCMLVLLLLCALMLFRPLLHKVLPFIAPILAALCVITWPLGCAMVFWPLGVCRALEAEETVESAASSGSLTSFYWHSLFLCWIHACGVATYTMLFRDHIRMWIVRGWKEGMGRGFCARERERVAFVAG
jgi:hypothetical protein